MKYPENIKDRRSKLERDVRNFVRRTEKVAGQNVRQLKIFISRLIDYRLLSHILHKKYLPFVFGHDSMQSEEEGGI